MLSYTSAKGSFHHCQEHLGPHSILKQHGKEKQSDHIEQQHVLSAIKTTLDMVNVSTIFSRRDENKKASVVESTGKNS